MSSGNRQQLLCILLFGMICLSIISMMFVEIMLAVCMLVGMVVWAKRTLCLPWIVSSLLFCNWWKSIGFVVVCNNVVCCLCDDGKWSDDSLCWVVHDSACWVVHDVRLYSGLDTVVYLVKMFVVVWVFVTLVCVFLFSVRWSELLMTSAISCPLWSSVYECQRGLRVVCLWCALCSFVVCPCQLFCSAFMVEGMSLF